MEIIKTIIDFILHIDVHLSEIIKDYRVWTYLILFIIIFAETGFVITPFLPGDSLLIAAGALIGVGDTGLNIYILAVLLILAAIMGNTVNYETGRVLGAKVFKPENKVLKLEYYTQTNIFFEKHGARAIIIGRFLPILRTIVPFVAGIGKLERTKFNSYNIIGGATWVSLFLFAGYFLGNFPFFKKNFSLIILLIIALTILPAIYAVIQNRLSKRVKNV
ncbi:DedA family protein [Pedobacter sp. SD-b]|uniref:DedA family protein n=1 Tax=Pedobacter segetis TaxID=2793069 RepID=A0ABS1BMT2_9SPHI|nr:DedA family protein [Pedobacter segetis]MBK0384193.1 DedA family protein [Pedobacter segetis]